MHYASTVDEDQGGRKVFFLDRGKKAERPFNRSTRAYRKKRAAQKDVEPPEERGKKGERGRQNSSSYSP